MKVKPVSCTKPELSCIIFNFEQYLTIYAIFYENLFIVKIV
jgi:hypothetical protein